MENKICVECGFEESKDYIKYRSIVRLSEKERRQFEELKRERADSGLVCVYVNGKRYEIDPGHKSLDIPAFISDNPILSIVPGWSDLAYELGIEGQENKISNLDEIRGFSKLTDLEKLRIEGHNISDISQLRMLKELKMLDLQKNQIENIDVLAELENLEELNLSGNKIKDIRPLRNLKKLRKLVIGANRNIENLEELGNLENLEELAIGGIVTRDISFLSKLKKLK